MKIGPYCQQKKCRPWILVSVKIRIMRIFAWFSREMASNESGSSKMAIFAFFHHYIFWTFIYNTAKCFFIELEIGHLEWSWMAFFAVKSVLGSACHGFACSGFRTTRSGICRAAHCQRQNVAPRLCFFGDIRCMLLFTGVSWRRKEGYSLLK